MSSENFERHIEFILAQEARSAAKFEELIGLVVSLASGTLERFRATDRRADDVDEKISALVDSQVRAEDRHRNLDEKFAVLVDSQLRAQARVDILDQKYVVRCDNIDGKIAALVDADLQAQERHRKLDEKFAVLIESQARTDESVKKTNENLRSLTGLVDRYISRRRNGRSNDKP
jgi:hypothetical protein